MGKVKILIGTVTSEVKDYCWKPFKQQLKNLQALGHDILIIDNSVRVLNRPPFKTINYNPRKAFQAGGNALTVVTRDCMNILRDEFLKGDYTHLFILESDVFIEIDKLQRLVELNADVANFTYPMNLERNNGRISLCVQSRDVNNKCRMITPEDSKDLLKQGVKVLNVDTLNGKTLSHCGYGCTLVKRKVLEQIEFKAVTTPDGIQPFPDSMFHEDVKNHNFSNLLDTDYLPFHANLHNETKKHRQVLAIQSKTTRSQRRANKRSKKTIR